MMEIIRHLLNEIDAQGNAEMGPKTITAPEALEFEGDAVFLAGSIEMDTASRWQEKVIEGLSDWNGTILNPRRKEWDSSWKQEIENDKFREQVEWELDAMEKATKVAVYFDPETKSPITLLELGLHAHDGKLIVCCPDGFWRKGNVDIVCQKYKIQQVETLEDLISNIKGSDENAPE